MLILKISLSLLFIALCIYLKRDKTPRPYIPKAGEPLANYEADFINLSFMMGKALTNRQLNEARKSIYSFRDRYEAYREPIALRQDIKRLRDKYKKQRLAVASGIATIVKVN